ncbi:MAG: dihydroorotase [Muribaculaceae bacterium]|nr:dihydroorotase [Muribaculaceae bacterium]
MSSKNKIVLTNGKVYTDKGLEPLDVLISNGKVEKISAKPIDLSDAEVYNIEGYVVLPSFIDMHVHLREPGFSYKETIKTGTEAAAAGGFTTVCPMPNLNPTPDSIENLQKQLDIIQKDARINVIPFASITKSRLGNQPVDYEALAPFVAGFSDDGSGVQDEAMMKKAMEGIAKTGKLLSAHCEVEELLNGGYIHAGEYADAHNHKGISSASEWKEVERDIRLAEETGCRLHICHISTKESVELVRKAKEKGLPVTCETGPHYLTFNDSDLKEEGRFKMNPPIRSWEDQEALRKGVADGTIDVIATDHAPHSEKEKSKGLEKSAMGVVGLETAFPAVYTTMVASGIMPFERLIEVMAANPRRLLGLQEISHVKEGMPADLVVVSTDEKFTVNPDEFKSMGRATPYAGMELQGKIKMTIYNGNTVYNSL